MKDDGKQLERLVAFVEQTLLPHGFEVKTNTRMHNEAGIQIAEFDVEIRGRLGSTDIAWLIECRDRPSQGPSPGGWIEQLVGRRSRFGFNKVTAVSTTGFAEGAVDYGRQAGIELREVRALTPEHFADWLLMRHLHLIEHVRRLDGATLIPAAIEPAGRQALLEALSGKRLDEPILLSTETGELAPAVALFSTVLSLNPQLMEGVAPNQPGKPVRLRVQYPDESSHFTVGTAAGPVRIVEIHFQGIVGLKETLVPLTVTTEYDRTDTGKPISQLAAFSFSTGDAGFALEMHRIAESGETHVLLHRRKREADV